VRQQVIEVGSTFKGFDAPKTKAGRRSVPIWPPIVAVVEEQLATRAQPGKDGLVFVNTRSNTPHLSSFSSQTWKKARGAIGRPDLHWHDLRHTYLAIRIAAGAHPKEIQEECGHSSYKTTMDIYGHLFESSAERTGDAVEAMFNMAQKAPARSNITALG
jgi:integrase